MSQEYSEHEEDNVALTSDIEPEIKIPIAIEWIINHFKPLDEDFYTSKGYFLSGYPQFEYYLTIAVDEDDEDIMKIYLIFQNFDYYKNYKIQIDCNVYLDEDDVSSISENLEEHLEDADNRHGEYHHLTIFECSKDEWKNEYAETLEFIKVKGIFNIQKIFTKDLVIEEAEQNAEIQNLFEDVNERDFSIFVGKNELKIHKSILQENSPVFAEMFNSDNWIGTNENKMEIKDFRFKHVKIAFEALYGRSCDKQLGIHEYISLYRFADKYDMEKLRKAIKNSIILTPNNVCRYSNLFFSKDLDELVGYCIDFMLLCSQYSLAIQNMDDLDASIKNRFFDRIFSSSVMKRNVEIENSNDNDQVKFIHN